MLLLSKAIECLKQRCTQANGNGMLGPGALHNLSAFYRVCLRPLKLPSHLSASLLGSRCHDSGLLPATEGTLFLSVHILRGEDAEAPVFEEFAHQF